MAFTFCMVYQELFFLWAYTEAYFGTHLSRPQKIGAMSAGAKTPGRVTLAGQALAEEPDKVCPTTHMGGEGECSSGVVKPTHLRE
jgi:hypothetical protein